MAYVRIVTFSKPSHDYLEALCICTVSIAETPCLSCLQFWRLPLTHQAFFYISDILHAKLKATARPGVTSKIRRKLKIYKKIYKKAV